MGWWRHLSTAFDQATTLADVIDQAKALAEVNNQAAPLAEFEHVNVWFWGEGYQTPIQLTQGPRPAQIVLQQFIS